MALATLLVMPTTDAAKHAFAWEHAMSHRSFMAVMGPLTQWSAVPYLIDPAETTSSFEGLIAGTWRQDHQQTHDDFNSFLPAFRQATVPGIPSHQILMDESYQSEGTRQWQTFANHMEHKVASDAILPLPAVTEQPQPWWAQPPRQVLTYW